MKALAKTAATLALLGALAGCDDYLTGDDLSGDPNIPPAATTDQLYHAVVLAQFVQHTGDLARHASMFTQQMAGVGNQLTGRGQYILTEQDLNGAMDAIYLGGGLYDLREIIRRSDAAQDRRYAGIARVWEAYLMGESASLWGDLPYSEAVGENQTPKLDPQAEIYAAVQPLLDQAIADLQSGAGRGPGAVDLIYGGAAAPWAEVAHTLKARFYLHWVEAQAGGAAQAMAQTACAGDCVAKAHAAAQRGISATANDFRSAQVNSPNAENLWYQFMFVQRQGQISAGRYLVDLLKERGDPRLTRYFRPLASGQIVGADPGGALSSLLSSARGAPDFRQPMATYAETQLILAETSWRRGDAAQALVHLNAARAAEGLTPPLTGLTGAALLREIMLEKYIAMFQNIEAWNDYKRTCLPALRPARGSEVIGRLLYSNNERNTNPNIPAVSAQPARNANDPTPCPAP